VSAAPRAASSAARRAALPGTLACALLLGACASRGPAPRPAEPRPDRDGPHASPPPGLERVPDAVPRVEPLRVGGPNKPYEVFGRRYVPMTDDLPLREVGGASWYGRKFHGQPTSSGEPYDMHAMTAAHRTMPIPSYARVRNPANGREVIVRVNDRGPFVDGRVIDLSYTAALRLGLLGGVATVEVERLTHDDIRAGRWRGADDPIAAFARALPAGPDDGVPGDTPVGTPPPGWWLQLGAFRTREAARQWLQRTRDAALADGGASSIALFEEDGWFRVQAGPFADRAAALDVAQRLRERHALSAQPVERR
jgi:rare lipoprotein A